MYCFQQDDEIYIVDCGIKFADEQLPGIDGIICPFDYLVENKEAIVYVSVLNDEKIRMFENKFKNLIIKNDLNNKVLYLNLTNESVEINKKYLSNLSEVPTLIIFDEGKVVESYSIKDNNYDIKAFEKFLKKEEIIND